MSRDVQPGPAQRRQQLGPRVGVETRRAERVAHLGDQRLEPLRPGAARRPRSEQVGEQPLVDVDPPRHPGVASSRPRRGRPTTPPRAAARAGRPRSMPPPQPAAGRPRGRRAGARPCRRPRTGRVGRRARPEPVPVLRLLPVQQPPVHGGGPPQQVVAQPQVVAAPDPHPGRQQRRVPPSGVVPHPARRFGLARAARTPAGRPREHLAAPGHRRPPARGRPAGARARPGSWGHPDTRRRRHRRRKGMPPT